VTLNEVAERLHAEGLTQRVLSRNRIMQIEKEALRKLRDALVREGLTFEDLYASE
jgi:DNA-directed RNA polymerase sigma subunit (sigma70/sigma32)